MPPKRGAAQSAQSAQPSGTREPTRAELCQSSRDLSSLVSQVNAVLPQFAPDLVCEALIQNDEDVERTVEYLLTAAFETKTSKKKKKKKPADDGVAAKTTGEEDAGDAAQEDPAEASHTAAPEAPREPPRENTAAEKTVLRLKKKLREIERIEERIASGEKVDKMQLPKLERKTELEAELFAAMEAVQAEELQLEQEREQARLEEEIERQRLKAEAHARAAKEAAEAAEERAAAEAHARAASEAEARRLTELRRESEEAERRDRQQSRRPPVAQQQQEQQQQQQPAPAYRPTLQLQPNRSTDPKGMELLSMLHGAAGAASYTQAEKLARDLGGKGSRVQRFPGSRNEAPVPRSEAPSAPPQPQSQRHSGDENGSSRRDGGKISHKFSDQGTWGEEAVDSHSFMNEYSTPLDVSSISADKQRMAERIAKEIEGPGDDRGDGYRGGSWRPGLWQQRDGGDGGSGGGRWRDDRGDGKGGGKKGGNGGSYNGYGGGRYGDRDGYSGGGKKGGGKGKGDGKGKGKRREKGGGKENGDR